MNHDEHHQQQCEEQRWHYGGNPLDTNEIIDKLAEPFSPKRVHWRVGPKSGNSTIPLAYVDARDVMDRLDEVVGNAGWEDSYAETASGRVICSLSINLGEGGRWITKADGAGDTGTEGEKGAISDAFKRAAVKFGVGRYLYGIKADWIDLENGKIPRAWLDHTAPQLLPTYRPTFWADWRKFTDALMEHCESVLKIKEWLGEDDFVKALAEMEAIPNDDKLALNRAWTKGGPFTTRETKQIKWGNNDFEKSRKDVSA